MMGATGIEIIRTIVFVKGKYLLATIKTGFMFAFAMVVAIATSAWIALMLMAIGHVSIWLYSGQVNYDDQSLMIGFVPVFLFAMGIFMGRTWERAKMVAISYQSATNKQMDYSELKAINNFRDTKNPKKSCCVCWFWMHKPGGSGCCFPTIELSHRQDLIPCGYHDSSTCNKWLERDDYKKMCKAWGFDFWSRFKRFLGITRMGTK